ncbi:hypothetical protein [Clostridium botulinum]|uniref:Exported protein n=1 Tax=Clostridium botulinum (strain Hall / ATCC 3502 / NCTC 13319 / Type A) TaxID=441771 RepID=A5I0I0_CLOBH|nr:hypothetical protein [Clostridium botulinum]ABS34967.1 conserved hypothetical protein [Clostridium botulinum A str. ATCC 19397]ABS36671.1 conserved hypothetical protein [Clostridium botulinum A str. Hall]AWB16906.1 hypothetical protein DB732_05395 [Clostridium botulinum]AWB29704.1 hypothetical protein DBN47_05375 [Clostridium botulinum]EGT5614779.1 hypothetical protein [Clostridium botulinum]
MKKRNNLIIVCLVVIIIAGSGILYKNYFTNIDSNNYLSSKNESEKSFFYYSSSGDSDKNAESFDFKRFNGKWSLMEFTSSKGNKINIKDNTKIAKGKLFIVVLDSECNIITKKDETKQKGDINFTTPKDGKYFIRIVGAKASGKFDISVNATKNIDISHIDFFS